MVELEAESERQSIIFARRSRIYASLYYLFGLPAAVLAAIAGATALASTTGRIVAGVIALASSALSAAVVFLDSGKQRDRSAQTRAFWDDLYNTIHVARLTKLRDYDVVSGPAALNDFYMRASSIRAGRNPEDETNKSAQPGYFGDEAPPPCFLSSAELNMCLKKARDLALLRARSLLRPDVRTPPVAPNLTILGGRMAPSSRGRGRSRYS